MRKPLKVWPSMSAAYFLASSGELASLMNPALPRPPAWAWALTTLRPSAAAAWAAPSGSVTIRPRGIGNPALGEQLLGLELVELHGSPCLDARNVMPLNDALEVKVPLMRLARGRERRPRGVSRMR